jgi:hypothetical protein
MHYTMPALMWEWTQGFSYRGKGGGVRNRKAAERANEPEWRDELHEWNA